MSDSSTPSTRPSTGLRVADRSRSTQVRAFFDGISEVATARASGGRRPRRRAEILAADKILRRLEELDKDADVRKALRGVK